MGHLPHLGAIALNLLAPTPGCGARDDHQIEAIETFKFGPSSGLASSVSSAFGGRSSAHGTVFHEAVNSRSRPTTLFRAANFAADGSRLSRETKPLSSAPSPGDANRNSIFASTPPSKGSKKGMSQPYLISRL